MRSILLLLLSMSLGACASEDQLMDESEDHPRHQGDQVPIHPASDFSLAELEGAADILGLELVHAQRTATTATGWSTGTIKIYRFRLIEDGLLGTTNSLDHCTSYIGSISRDDVLAHELGHVLGLAHTGTQGNLMQPTFPRDEISEDLELTDAQVQVMRNRAWTLTERCPDSD